MLIGHIDVLLLVDNIPVGVVAWHSYQAIEEIAKHEGAGRTFLNTEPRLKHGILDTDHLSFFLEYVLSMYTKELVCFL